MSQVFSDISIEFDTVSVERGDQRLFEGLSFQISSGEVLWLRGTNGIGKTTILRLAAGLARPDHGAINWFDSGIHASPSQLAAYQGHKNAQKKHLTAIEDLTFWARLAEYNGSPVQILSEVALSDKADVRTGYLSAGQSRRLAIARLIVSQRPIWILDEPAAAMDKDGQALILSVINNHIAQGGLALIASHDEAITFSGPARRLSLEAA